MFLNGEAAMITIPTDQLTGIVGSPQDNGSFVYTWGINFPDSPYNQNIAIKMVGNGYGVGANVARDQAKLDAIIDFQKYRFTPEGAAAVLPAGFSMPIKASVPARVTPIIQQMQSLLADNRQGTITSAYVSYYAWGSNVDIWLNFYNPESTLMNACMDGSITRAALPAELQKMNTLVRQAMADYRNMRR
jgi:hypothetical protein